MYQARHRATGEIVALKKLRMDRERDGMPVTSVREVGSPAEIDHCCIRHCFLGLYRTDKHESCSGENCN